MYRWGFSLYPCPLGLGTTICVHPWVLGTTRDLRYFKSWFVFFLLQFPLQHRVWFCRTEKMSLVKGQEQIYTTLWELPCDFDRNIVIAFFHIEVKDRTLWLYCNWWSEPVNVQLYKWYSSYLDRILWSSNNQKTFSKLDKFNYIADKSVKCLLIFTRYGIREKLTHKILIAYYLKSGCILNTCTSFPPSGIICSQIYWTISLGFVGRNYIFKVRIPYILRPNIPEFVPENGAWSV